MALTKSNLIESIAETNEFSKKKSSEKVEIILENIKSTLTSGENVLIANSENSVSRINGSAKVGSRFLMIMVCLIGYKLNNR